MPNNTNFQTFHQMGTAINEFVKQATGRDNVQNIDIDHVTVAQNHYYEDVDVSGPIASFMAGIVAPLDSCIVSITPIQSGSGDPSPDNVRPITGRTGCNVVRAGNNICPMAELPDNPQPYWGTGVASFTAFLNSLPAGTYTIGITCEVVSAPDSGVVSHGRPYITANVNGATVVLLSYSVSSDNSASVGKTYRDIGTFTITEETKGKIDHCYFYCDRYDQHSGTGRGTYNIKDIQIEFGSTATPYETYQGQTYSINWQTEAGTVYGGTLDVTTGTLVVTHKMFEDSGSGWTKNANGSFYKWIAGIGGIILTNSHDGLSNYGQYIYSNTGAGIYANGNNGTLNIGSDANMFETVEELQTAFSSVPLQVLAPLAEPQTYQLTPVEITTLLGLNNIWADTGSIEVKFTDIKELY